MNPDRGERLMFIAGCKKDLHVTVNAKWRRRVGFRIGKYLLSLKSSEPESLTGILLKNGKKIPHPNQPTNQPNSKFLRGGKKEKSVGNVPNIRYFLLTLILLH